MKHGKKYLESAKLVDRATLYDPAEALDLAVKTSSAKFDETVEIHVRLGVDSRHADQQVRGAVVLPNGTGKKVRVAVFAKGDAADAAAAAGAEIVGAEDLVAKIQGEGFLDFDVAIAAPNMMGLVGRLGKVLFRRTTKLFLTLSTRQSRLHQRVSTSEAALLLQQWAPAYVSTLQRLLLLNNSNKIKRSGIASDLFCFIKFESYGSEVNEGC